MTMDLTGTVRYLAMNIDFTSSVQSQLIKWNPRPFQNPAQWQWSSRFCEWTSLSCEWASRFCEWTSRFCEWTLRFWEWTSLFCEWASRFCEWTSRFCEWVSRFCEWTLRFWEWASRFCEIRFDGNRLDNYCSVPIDDSERHRYCAVCSIANRLDIYCRAPVDFSRLPAPIQSILMVTNFSATAQCGLLTVDLKWLCNPCWCQQT